MFRHPGCDASVAEDARRLGSSCVRWRPACHCCGCESVDAFDPGGTGKCRHQRFGTRTYSTVDGRRLRSVDRRGRKEGSMNLRRLKAVTKKEFLHILRDWRSLVLALAIPLNMLLLFGYALTLDVDRIPTYVYDWDRTPESRELVQQFRGSRYFDIID